MYIELPTERGVWNGLNISPECSKPGCWTTIEATEF